MRFERFENFEIHDSKVDSELELVFVPGIGGTEVWRHQVKYFSDDFRTLTFKSKDRSLDSLRAKLDRLLNQKDLNNTILVASDLGNFVAKPHGRRDEIASNVVTGCTGSLPTENPTIYNTVISAVQKKPKIAKKLFFSPKTSYDLVKEFTRDMQKMDKRDFLSYRNQKMEPLKNALYIQGKRDIFSDPNDVKQLEPDVSFRRMGGGSFCFYEKPEEFNKAVFDFITRLSNFMESREIREKKERNKSLKEYKQSSLRAGVKKW